MDSISRLKGGAWKYGPPSALHDNSWPDEPDDPAFVAARHGSLLEEGMEGEGFSYL